MVESQGYCSIVDQDIPYLNRFGRSLTGNCKYDWTVVTYLHISKKSYVRPSTSHDGFLRAQCVCHCVCGQKLRDQWQQQGSNVSIIDLRRTYIQVHTYKSLRFFQKWSLRGKCRALSGVGGGGGYTINNEISCQWLNESILNMMLTYIDNIFVHETVVPTIGIRRYLERHGHGKTLTNV